MSISVTYTWTDIVAILVDFCVFYYAMKFIEAAVKEWRKRSREKNTSYSEPTLKEKIMNELPLEYFVKLINDELDSNNARLAEILDMPTDRVKVTLLTELLGTAHGDLLFLQDEMKKEMEIRKNKKFWQFWK